MRRRFQEFGLLGLGSIQRLAGDDVSVHLLHQRFLEALHTSFLGRFGRQDGSGSGREALD